MINAQKLFPKIVKMCSFYVILEWACGLYFYSFENAQHKTFNAQVQKYVYHYNGISPVIYESTSLDSQPLRNLCGHYIIPVKWKWMSFYRQHLYNHFLEWRLLHCFQFSLKFVPKGLTDNNWALAQVMVWRQAIIWTSDSQFYWHIYQRHQWMGS